MYMLKVTITTTGVRQPVIPLNAGVQASNTNCQGFIPQNNGSNSMTIGDSSVATGNGLVLAAASLLGSAQAFLNPINLLDLYVLGTAADVLNIMVFP